MSYRYHALDIAAYLKWASVSPEAEPSYLSFFYQLREEILARPFTRTYEEFCQAVFREMYHVWSRGFENEFSDVNRIAGEETLAIFCEPDFLALESYMKLLALHLMVSVQLPYIRIQLAGLPLLLGLAAWWERFALNLGCAAEALALVVCDEADEPMAALSAFPVQPVHIRLCTGYRKKVLVRNGKTLCLMNDSQEKLQVLRESSRLAKEMDDERKRAVVKERSAGRKGEAKKRSSAAESKTLTKKDIAKK